MSKEKYLFNEFTPVSEKEWKQQIQMELKGADYTKTLVWESLENIKVKPFYHIDSYEYLEIPAGASDFTICQEIFIDDPAIANKIALESLAKGANALLFSATKSFDIDILFQGFDRIQTPVTLYFKNYFLSKNFTQSLLDYFEDNRLVILQDPIGTLARNGNWFFDKNDDFRIIKELLEKNPTKKILNINAGIYQNAGANMVQQIAYALAHANEYLSLFGVSVAKNLQFEFAIGSNYFFEIAKLRAFRYLWQEVIKDLENIPAIIMTKPSLRNKTIYDYNVNLLRTTTESMSAILGGSDTIVSMPYDAVFRKSGSFSERIARNQLLILKEENFFKDAAGFSKGSYYIEALTVALSKKALQLFKEIEASGGFLKQLEKGTIQTKIAEAAAKEQQLFDSGDIILLGTNKYPNKDEKLKDEVTLFPFQKKQSKQTLIRPIIPKRLAEKIEKQRLDNE